MKRKSSLARCALLLIISTSISLFLFSQNNFKVSGKVIDEVGKPVSGATVAVKGTTIATATSLEGLFVLNVPSAKSVLVITSIGFEGQEIILNNRTEISISMTTSAASLSDVVVVGYGTQKKRNITGAVATFNAANLDERPVLRVDQALVGQLAGVTVKQTSGGLGKGFQVQVRGTGSISAGNEPLYVIDGFPLATSTVNENGVFSTGNPLDNIDPNDIETIQVLKDAASAAIYGSRAANGVVLITTKRGKTGKAQINVNTYMGYTERSRKLDMLSAEEWIDRATEMINAQWVASGAGRTATQTNEERRVILGLAPGVVNTSFMSDDRWFQPGHPGLVYLDWQDEAFRKGLVQNHQVSASGGNDFVKYYVSGNYSRQEGMIINTDFTAYSLRANVEVNANKKLRFGININPTYSVNNDPGIDVKDNIIHQIVTLSPVQEDTMGVYQNFGNEGQYRWSNTRNSPIGQLETTIGQTRRFRTLGSIFGEYDIIRGLTFKTTVNLDNTDNNAKAYYPWMGQSALATRQANPLSLIRGTYNTYRKQTFANENTLSYNKVIKRVHDIAVVIGQGYYQDKLDRVTMSSTQGYSSAVVTTLNAAVGVTGNTTETRNTFLSYFGRIQYAYDQKYLLSASLRRDASSRFGSNNRWATFPAVSVGWIISNETFMQTISQLSELKLRASWGKAGNYTIPDYGSIPTLSLSNYSFNGAGVTGQAPSGIVNPDLGWELSETKDIGLDIGFLRNRFTASFDYYIKDNTRLLLNVPIPIASGFSTYLSNAGAVRNKGWEIEVTSRNMTGKEFQWTTSANLSHNTNKVVTLAGGQTQILIPSSFDINHSILKIGQPMYSIYVVKMLGILSAQDIASGAALFGTEKEGDPKYEDIDKNGVIDANDRQIVGHPNPDYIWGVNNTFKYKGFDLGIMVQGQWGGSIYSLFGRALGRTGQGYVDNALGTFRHRWRSASDPGDGKISKAYSTFGRIVNTDWLYPSDYVRVRNITLGYNLKKHIKANYIHGARIYVTLENFFGHDKYLGGFNPEAVNTDVSGSSVFPEAADYGGGPLPRSFIFGLNFTF
jgi:TonB-linked SusC/RagA family outer membrane protein